MNLDKMSLRELNDLNTRVAQAIYEKEVEAKRAARVEVLSIIARPGLSIDDLKLKRVPKHRLMQKPKRTNGVLHRNPADPTQT